MKITVDLPLDVIEGLATHAIREQRFTPQQAAHVLIQWVRDEQPAPPAREPLQEVVPEPHE